MMLVVFLGNPGAEYKLTRHNSGFIVAENMALTQDLCWSRKFFGMFAKKDVNGHQHCFLKPETFMNLSGKSVQAARSFFKLNESDIVVVHDDIETEFGVVSFRKGGGLAGHNGLRSIANSIGSPDFLRIKIGVGRPKKGDVSSFVLGKFTPEEMPFLPVMAEAAEEKLKELLQ